MAGVDRNTVHQTGVVTSAALGRALPRSCVARVVKGAGDEAASFSVGGRAIVVGAHGSCDVVVEDPQVSRRHVELSAVPGGVKVRDLGSTNGTLYQGSRVAEVIVPIGASIRVGGAAIKFLAAETPTVAPSERTRFGGMVGRSLAMRELFAVLELASPTDVTVLLEGESGTGKELAARALHDHSSRARVPLVVVDCSGVSESLIESHLFGHVRGAFTGASGDRNGAFVQASGGTLFLDEIGELPLPSQAKLLRALEARTVQPVGSDRPVKVDARVVAATHRDLAAMVEAKQFRFDLYYRLAVVHALIPPLRERSEDLPELVRHFYEGRGIDPGPIDGANLARLEHYGWPGNVRELRNVLERAWALSGVAQPPFRDLKLWVEGAAGATETAGAVVDTTLPFKDAKENWVDQFERRYVSAVFSRAGGNITRAAEHAELSRRHFRMLLRKHGIIAE